MYVYVYVGAVDSGGCDYGECYYGGCVRVRGLVRGYGFKCGFGLGLGVWVRMG